jgi:hypothetical protein
MPDTDLSKEMCVFPGGVRQPDEAREAESV